MTDDAQKKRALAALVVHDLRNPLTALQGYLDLAVDDLAAQRPERVAQKLANCLELVEQTLGLVATILDVDELEDGMLRAKPEALVVAALVAQCERRHRARFEEFSIHFASAVPGDLRVQADPNLLHRVVENLMDNACRYTPRGGRIAIFVEQPPGWLALCVANSGPPVALADQQAIFGRYYQVEKRREAARANRGLGLYFCKLAMEAHGGSIAIESRDSWGDSWGTVFVLRLPVTDRL